jgi:hypothetical protein
MYSSTLGSDFREHGLFMLGRWAMLLYRLVGILSTFQRWTNGVSAAFMLADTCSLSPRGRRD